MLKDKDRIFQNLYNDMGQMLLPQKKEGIGLIQKILQTKEEIG